MTDGARQTGFGLYCHIPFCIKKCPYCNFFSTTNLKLVPAFFEAIKKEALLFKKKWIPSYFDRCNTRFDTLYIGGGTPSIINPAQLGDLVNHLRFCFPFSKDTEITIEVNPGDLSCSYLEALLKLGINRLNIGIQSFSQDSLAFLGRRHTPVEAKNSIDIARNAGFKNIGIDLIYGQPGQTIESWFCDLDCAIDFAPEHISCYQLTVEEGTVLGRRLKQGRLDPISEDEEYEFLLATSAQLTKAGYYHYEVSNFARNKRLVSRHNIKYWLHVPYLGLGPSAHSFSGYERWWNYGSIEKYCNAIKERKYPIEGRETITKESLRLESLYFAFRTRFGLDLKSFREEFGQDLTIDPPGILPMLEKEGRVEVSGGKIRPTLEGIAVADAMALLF